MQSHTAGQAAGSERAKRVCFKYYYHNGERHVNEWSEGLQCTFCDMPCRNFEVSSPLLSPK